MEELMLKQAIWTILGVLIVTVFLPVHSFAECRSGEWQAGVSEQICLDNTYPYFFDHEENVRRDPLPRSADELRGRSQDQNKTGDSFKEH
jgi:hypothetical protein